MTFTPSDRQKNIAEALRGSSNLLIQACAGSGKTTTMVWLAGMLPPHMRVLALSFNKSIADELSKRMPHHVRSATMHSVGYGMIRKAAGKVRLEDKKLIWLIDNHPGVVAQSPAVRQSVVSDLLSIVPLVQDTMVDPENLSMLAAIADMAGRELEAASISLPLVASISAACDHMKHYITFGEMIRHPIIHDYPSDYFDVVFVDEAQDLNSAQHALLKKLVRPIQGKLVAVGDVFQCQPAGTVVEMTGGGRKYIQDIRAGDSVVSFDRHAHAFVGRVNQGRSVLEVASRNYTGKLLKISAGGKSTHCTPEHRWLCRFQVREVNKWCVYMMRRGVNYRVGWCQLFTAVGGNHVLQRARIEDADSVWILSVHDTKEAASLEESYVSAAYGIPLVMFKQTTGNRLYTQQGLDALFARLNAGINMAERARICLEAYGRLLDLPFATCSQYERRGRTTVFEMPACNLLPGMMSIPVYDGGKLADWQTLHIDTMHVSDTVVYSLKVDTHEMYVADGLLTHNSIYSFRGADPRSMERLAADWHMTKLPLDVSYRCASSVVKEAQRIVGDETIKARPDAPAGEVTTGNYEALGSLMQEGDMGICRCNAPLIGVALKCIKAGKRVQIRGRDIGAQLAGIVRKSRAATIPALLSYVTDWRMTRVQAGIAAKRSDQALQAIEDNADTITAIAEECTDVQGVLDALEDLFSDLDRPCVVLSTVHKAKGLEATIVFILGPELLPAPWAESANEKEQERNIHYVAVTRAMERLVYVKLPDKRK